MKERYVGCVGCQAGIMSASPDAALGIGPDTCVRGVRPTRPRLPPPSCYDFAPKGVHLHRRLTRAARACGIAAVAWPRCSTQADTRVTESAGSSGALLVTSLCDGPAPAAPLAGSHPRRTAGTPCGRAGDVIRSALSFKVVHSVPAVRGVETGQK